ncbi:clostripain-related cysteine peptidase [uncultured Mediterranea sp.]|uniref:clostripain-related cysteine peptidase n=1 Tax=uncultured Mediterranea sp. TaxID=1926662 RepID=UPI002586DCB0|nr:clostripain-related cysteine peptidase [uncultured Mediterranea sp.]
MFRRNVLVVMLLSLLALASCDKEEAPEPSSYKRTVLVYIVADNNLLSGFAEKDLAEMKEGMAQVSDGTLHLLVYIDTGSSPRLVELKKQNGQVVEDVVRTYDDRNSVGVDETREVFADVFSNPDFLAEGYGLIYWSHGDGWIPYGQASTRWVGQDNGDGDHRMNISELASVLEGVPHLDFLMFDACFMSSVEVAYELRSFTDYYIGSPTENPGPGAPYERLVPLMAVDQAEVEMSKAYFAAYEEIYDGTSPTNTNWTGGVSICVMRTDALEALATLTAQLLPAEVVDIAALKKAVFDYDHDGWGRDYVGYFDLKQLMEQVLDDASYATWTQAFDAAIAYWSTTPKNYSQFVGMFSMEGANGITHYIPGSSTQRDAAYHSMKWYQDAGLEKLGW